jgi:hypothetical protein
MPGSYREIDYRVRPGKQAERLMMVEAFRHLRFSAVGSYQYVGLGSVYFSDFKLVHRALGTTRMISIEKSAHDKKGLRPIFLLDVLKCYGVKLRRNFRR